jgi:hypothetical protein
MDYWGAYIAYYIVAAISGACSIFVVVTLCTCASFKTAATQLLLMLHITLLAEELASLPYAFNGNDDLCSAIAFLHYYSGLANVIATGLLVVSYRYHFLEDRHGIMTFIQKYSILMVAVFPLITLLPFITNSYSNDNEVWCTMQIEHGWTRRWAFLVFFLWGWLIIIYSTGVLGFTMYQVYTVDKEIGLSLFSTTGVYAMISIMAWIPRTAIRFAAHVDATHDLNNMGFLYAYLPFYIAGILYTLVFLREKRALLLFDRLSDWTGDTGGSNPEVGASFSWETSSQRGGDGRERERSNSSTNSIERFSPKRGVYTPLIIPEQYLLE